VKEGAVFVCRAEVFSIERSGNGEELQTAAGTFRADQVVLAAGVWTRSLAAPLGLRLPLEAGKGYTVDLDAEAGPALPRRPLMLQESRIAVTPLAGRLRLAGTMQLSGLDDGISRSRVAALETEGRRRLPAWSQAPVKEVWAGLRPCTPDGLPVIERMPDRPRVLTATGHAMLGLTLAPVTAELLEEKLDRST
jgi:D-amino-acid dehydrogenase